MGAYRGSLVGERPAEGKAIKGGFELFASDLHILKVAVGQMLLLLRTDHLLHLFMVLCYAAILQIG